ncbi:MAG: hypothetical protein QM820_34000 [Minicystis sp.]
MGVLPLCFTDAERAWIARTVSPDVAALAPRAELSFRRSGVACSADDIVLSTPSMPVSALARSYAAITGRRLVLDDPPFDGATFAGKGPGSRLSQPRSVTWLPSLDENDIASALDALRRALLSTFGTMPRLGVLTAESAVHLTWLLAKQLIPRDDRNPATTVASLEPMAARPATSIRRLGTAQSVAEVVAGFEAARGALFVSTHSRPHCGVLDVTDGRVGLCGLASGGAGGRCVDGGACYFGETPRAVMQNLDAQRVFFNGCSTGTVDSGLLPHHLPRAAMLSHAALRGVTREYVGNVRIGYYGEADLDWFLGASALGYTPAECVEIVEAARRTSAREGVPSALYFGDAINPAWPVEGASIGEVAIQRDGRALVHWSRLGAVFIARVPGKTWGYLAAADRLYAHIGDPSRHASVSVIADPWHDASLVLAVRRRVVGAEHDARGALQIELSPLAQPVDRAVGETLERAIEHLYWIEGLPAFSAPLSGSGRQLEDELRKLRAFAASRESITMLPTLLDCARREERQIARRFDDRLVEEALTRSRGPWKWGNEYVGRTQTKPATQWSACKACGGFAHESAGADYVNPRIKRLHKACSHCGLADLPACDLDLRVLAETVASATTVAGRAEISNNGSRPRGVTLGAAIAGGGEMQPGSITKKDLVLEPAATAHFAFVLTPVNPMPKNLQVYIYLASEGAFGMTNQYVRAGKGAGA